MSYIIVVRWPNEARKLQAIQDENDFIAEYDSEDDAENAMENHPLFNQEYEIVEIGV